MKLNIVFSALLSLCFFQVRAQVFNKIENSTYFGELNDGFPGDTVQVLLSGEYDTGVNDGSPEGTYKLKIEGYQNDGGVVYPIHVSDEDESLDFYIRNRPSATGLPRMFFSGDVYMGDEETSKLKLRWINNSASLQAGRASSTQWDNAGNYSFISGNNNSADGYAGVSFGQENKNMGSTALCGGISNTVTGQSSFTFGEYNLVNGFVSACLGRNNTVEGYYTFAGGTRNIVKSYAEVGIGRYNDTLSSPSPNFWRPYDILFSAGNGSSNSNRNNAFTIMKNGEVHFHKQDENPDAILIAHRGGPKYGGGGTFDFTGDSESGFVLEHRDLLSLYESSGIYGDGISLHLWSPGDENRLLTVHDEDDMFTGTSVKWYLDGSGNPSSLVENPNLFRPVSLKGAIKKVNYLQTLSYILPEEIKDGELVNKEQKQLHIDPNTLEVVLPELVDTQENGQKYIKYHGVIVLLTEAIKEQQTLITKLESEKKTMQSELQKMTEQNEEMNQRMLKIERFIMENQRD